MHSGESRVGGHRGLAFPGGRCADGDPREFHVAGGPYRTGHAVGRMAIRPRWDVHYRDSVDREE
jgi:hypothetical protein